MLQGLLQKLNESGHMQGTFLLSNPSYLDDFEARVA